MKDTQMSWDNTLDSTRFAESHNANGVIYAFRLREHNAADWLLTSMEDYCKFAIFVINGAGLSKKLFNEMPTIHANFNTETPNMLDGMGLGWEVIRHLPHGEYALTHDGDDNGVRTIVLLLQESKRGIVIFTNGDEGQKVYSIILKASKIDLLPSLAKYMEALH